ncbi:MAG: hypothetical protein K5683_07710 [Prevotella sp.]|nr:hypothetical protein [Prevotella sp.]
MKRLLFFFLFAAFVSPVLAQLNGNGYYRARNFKSERYIIMIDNKSKGANYTTTTYDLDAMMSVKPFDRVCSDPGSVVFVENCGGNQYNLKAQGTDVHATTGRYLTITQANATHQTYFCSASVSGVTVYLFDEQWTGNEGRLSTSNNIGGGGDVYRHWQFFPVSATDDSNYLGVKGEVAVGGKYYRASYYAFPYTFASSGMKAHIVTKLDGEYAVWQPLEGKVAATTPVIIECVGADASSNRLNLETADTSIPSGNILIGNYFDNSGYSHITESSYHFNATKYDANTMRLLGVTSQGKLGFVKSSLKYLPQNSSYLVVPAGSPDEITLVSQAEYDALIAADRVTVTARSYTREYGDANPTFEYDVEGTLKGQPAISCAATQSSPVGTYPIVVEKGTSTNRSFTGVNGTLTITPAPLTVTAQSYTIKQNEPLPQFAIDYAGFKLGETAAVLSSQPALTCDVPQDKTPGVYQIVVSGTEAANYAVSHVNGTLTILEADPITVTATSMTKVYGDAVPQLTWVVEGGTLEGQPALHCDVTESSLPGEYAITVSRGTLDYPNLVFVDGKLTVTKAPLVISAGTYSMKQNEERPEFKASFEGFKLGETEAVLTSQPVLTTTAPDDNTPGVYEVLVSGAEAANYDITYKAGRLTILQADEIVIVAADATMVYGDDVPELLYSVSGGELEGVPAISCEATSSSPAGTYPIVLSLGTVDYPNVKLVNGTLTITKAPLVISAGSYTMKQDEERPEFKASFEGFKLEETEAVLTSQPVFSTTAPVDNTPGEYEVMVSGAEAENYDITYKSGRLIILQADEIVIMATDATMVYGDNVPQLLYTVSGGELEGEPVVTCEATSSSPAGTYPIVISVGTVDYPNLKLVNGTLTITKAQLKASVANYEREQGQPNPDFAIVYEGFRNGDDPSVFTVAPTASTTATEESEPGVYDITIQGGEAQNYSFVYIGGKLIVNVPSSIASVRVFDAPVDIYTLTGRLVRAQATSTAGIPRGLYIAGGRKIVVK